MTRNALFKRAIDGLMILSVAACLWVFDLDKVLGLVFTWEQFRNWDTVVMMPGWAYAHGLHLNMDIKPLRDGGHRFDHPPRAGPGRL